MAGTRESKHGIGCRARRFERIEVGRIRERNKCEISGILRMSKRFDEQIEERILFTVCRFRD